MSGLQYGGLPFGEWERSSGRREIAPNGWRALTACTWPGGGAGLYLHQRGRVGWATAVGSFVVFDVRRIVYIAHERRVILWTVHTEDTVADTVQRVARALEAHPEIAEKVLRQATIEPEWERAARYLSLVYRTRDLDAGMNWDCLLNFALTSAGSIAWTTLQQAERAAAAEPTVTPERTLREAGIDDRRQAAYQRKMSTLLAGRQTSPTAAMKRAREQMSAAGDAHGRGGGVMAKQSKAAPRGDSVRLRMKSLLARHGLTLEQAKQLPDSDLRRRRGIGPKTIDAIRAAVVEEERHRSLPPSTA